MMTKRYSVLKQGVGMGLVGLSLFCLHTAIATSCFYGFDTAIRTSHVHVCGVTYMCMHCYVYICIACAE